VVLTEDRPASLASSSALLTATQVVGNTGFFVAILFVAHELTRSGRGLVAFATTVALIVARASEVGMTSATTVMAAQRPPDRPKLLVNVALFAIVAGLATGTLAVLALSLGGIGPNLTFLQLAAVASGVVGNTLLDAGYAYLVGTGRVRSWSGVACASPWLYAATLGALALTSKITVSSVLVAWAGAHLFWGVGALTLSVGRDAIAWPDWRLFRETLYLGLRAWGGTLSRFLNFRLDQVILGLMASESVLGVYATAVNASEVSLYVPVAVATAAIPSIARAPVQERAQHTLATFRTLLVITVGVVLVAALIGTPAVPLMFGVRYQAAVIPYLVLLPGALGYVAIGVLSAALLSSRRPLLSSAPSAASLIVGVVLDVILIPPLHATGAALAASLAFFTGGVAAVVAYHRVDTFTWRDLVPRARDLALLRRPAPQDLAASPRNERGKGSRLRLRSNAYYRVNHTYRRSRSMLIRRGPMPDWEGVRILGYHRVTDERDPLGTDPAVFRAQMEWLLDERIKPLRVDGIFDALHHPPTQRYFCVTFDDGYRDNLDCALPILEDLGIPATIYVATAVIDGTAEFDWYERPPAALSWDDLRAIQLGGLVDIQPHTRTHPILPRLTTKDAWSEIAGSKADLERNLGVPTTSFAYPAGIYGAREVELARKAGFATAVTTNAGVNADTMKPLELRRTLLLTGDTVRDFQAKVRGALDRTSRLERVVRRRRATPEG
jgi:O-antigen/teichoic acid export membrane protein/peptidoglycan/xylan/chitin deacetylase (PgdA/CDA1 family)